MHEHKQEPCWDAHCAPHLTHHDAGVRELIARAEARGAERVAQAVEALADGGKYVPANVFDKGAALGSITLAVRASDLDRLLAEHRAEATR